MASLYKPVYYTVDGKHRLSDGQRVTKHTYGAVKTKSKIWWGKYRGVEVGAGRPLCRVPLCANKEAAKEMLGKLETDARLAERGLVTKFEDSHKQPLADHLADFERTMLAERSTIKHARQVCGRVRRVLDGCGFVHIPDLSASRVQSFLADLQGAGA